MADLPMFQFVSEDSRDLNWFQKNVPCRGTCPTHTNIPRYIDAFVKGNYSLSYEINRRDNIFPGILGRICTKPCEKPCRHAEPGLGDAVSICHIKRAAWDYGRFDINTKWKKSPPTGKKIVIVGAGPAGLTCANELTLWGHDVSILEKEKIPGGMMTLSIPKFRLPREVTNYDLNSVLNLGIKLTTGVTLGKDFTVKDLASTYDAVIVAIGTMKLMSLRIPGEKGSSVRLGVEFLMDINKGKVDRVPEKVLVIGGGFTAVDCVRTAVRLGAKEVTLAYRRTKNEMFVHEHELEDMKQEGITEIFLCSPIEVIRDDEGEIHSVKMIRNRLGDKDSSGRRSPVPIEGSEFFIETDLLIPAIGQRADDCVVDGIDSWQSSRGQQIENQNVFFAGDFRIGATSVIDAIADGKEVSRLVHSFLDGESEAFDAVLVEEVKGPGTGRNRKDDFIELQEMPTLDLEKRWHVEAEVQLGFDKDTAKVEGKRCYLCDHDFQIDMDKCIYCSACIEAMPKECIFLARDVIDKGGSIEVEKAKNWNEVNAVVIDGSECIRCGNCVSSCPVDCISIAKMTPINARIGDEYK